MYKDSLYYEDRWGQRDDNKVLYWREYNIFSPMAMPSQNKVDKELSQIISTGSIDVSETNITDWGEVPAQGYRVYVGYRGTAFWDCTRLIMEYLGEPTFRERDGFRWFEEEQICKNIGIKKWKGLIACKLVPGHLHWCDHALCPTSAVCPVSC